MGSLASSVFSVMLGWIRSAVSYVWKSASSPEGSSVLKWLAENWLALAVIICLSGMAVDVVVHLLRWRSYKVWGSFIRRLSKRDEDDPEEEELPPPEPQREGRIVHRQWIYADGTARTESVEQEEIPAEEDAHPWTDVTPSLPNYELDQESYRRQFARPESQIQSVPSTSMADYPQSETVEEQQTVPEEESKPYVRRGRRITRESTRAALQQLFVSHDEDELDLRYKPAQPAMDKSQAYNKPYYPPQWKPPAENTGLPKDE